MPKKKKPAKKAAKKARKKPAKKARQTGSARAGRATKKTTAKAPKGAHLERAHGALVRVIDTVSVKDRGQIAKLRRLVDHLDANAKSKG